MKTSYKIYLPYCVFALLFTAASFLVGSVALRYANDYFYHTASSISQSSDSVLIVIDPGHGGEDGGASAGEVLEKDLNLTISEELSDLYTVFGYPVLLTRREDTLLYDHYGELEDYTGRKKAYDLRNRLRIAEESGASLYLGIHMNRFSDARYKGLQVYYSAADPGSKAAAEKIQSYAKAYLMPDNARQTKKATDSIYILHRIHMPAVLVECGFLSSPEELALLTTPAYQQKLSAAIFAASAEYLVSSDGLS